MSRFIASLQREDFAVATVRGYRYDLRHFQAWHDAIQGNAVVVERLTEFDLIAYRQAMIAAGNRPTTVNRLDALRHLCRWAQRTGAMAADIARPRPCLPTDAKPHHA